MKQTFRLLRSLTLQAGLLAGIAGAIAGCGLLEKDIPQYPCPEVLILGEADKLVRFKPGPGRDITDIRYEARLANFGGSCIYTKEGVEIDLRVTITVERGAAATDPSIELSYFVALPEYLPRPEGKRIMGVQGAFVGNRSRMIYQDEVNMFLPLDKGSDGPGKEVVLGLQLSADEIEYNRSLRR